MSRRVSPRPWQPDLARFPFDKEVNLKRCRATVNMSSYSRRFWHQCSNTGKIRVPFDNGQFYLACAIHAKDRSR